MLKVDLLNAFLCRGPSIEDQCGIVNAKELCFLVSMTTMRESRRSKNRRTLTSPWDEWVLVLCREAFGWRWKEDFERVL